MSIWPCKLFYVAACPPMSLGRFVKVPSLASEPWLGLLYEPLEGDCERQSVTLWERVCHLADSDDCRNPYPPPLAFGPPLACQPEALDVTATRNYRETKIAAARARWEKHNARQKQNQHWRKCVTASVQRTNVGVQCSLIETGERYCIDQAADDQSTKARLGTLLIEEAIRNMHRKSPRYSETFYHISALLYFSSAKTYRITRQLFWLPAISSIHRNYKDRLRDAAQRILNIEHVSETLESIKSFINEMNKNGENLNNIFTLGIDAFCFRSFSGCSIGSPIPEKIRSYVKMATGNRNNSQVVNEETVKFTHAFLFLLIPHDYRLPVKLLHLSAAENGSYGNEISEKANIIRETASKLELRMWCKSTDGDPGLSQEHTEFYEEHVRGKSSNFLTLVTGVHDWLCQNHGAWVPISDPLHVFKNMRSRLLCHPIVLLPSCPATCIEEIQAALQLGNALDDTSQTGKMRDCYVMRLFTFQNVIKLMKKGQIVAGYLLFPFACWIAVIFSEHIDLPFRKFLVELAFQVFSYWFDQLPAVARSGASYRAPVNGLTTFSDQQYGSRILNTLLFFGVALTFGSENMRMDALGTHLVENSIGLARAASNDPRYERVIQTYARTEVKKEIAAELGIKLHVQGRVNHGGCKVDPDHQRGRTKYVSKPEEWRVDGLLSLLHGACKPDTSPGLVGDIEEFIGELESVAAILDQHEYNFNDAANSGIMARLIAFKKEKRS